MPVQTVTPPAPVAFAGTPAAPAAAAAAPATAADQTRLSTQTTDSAARLNLGDVPWDDMSSEQRDKAIETILTSSSAATRDFLNTVAKPNFTYGRDAIFRLAAEGKLDAVNPDGTNLRDTIAQYVASGDSDQLSKAEDIVYQLGNPHQNITQATDNTCAAAIAQKTLAEVNPAAYFKLATDIIDRGETTLANGDTVKLDEPNRNWVDSNLKTGATIFDGMIQAALMNYAVGPNASFDIAADQTTGLDGQSVFRGLGIAQATRLDEALLKTPTVDTRGDVSEASIVATLATARRDGAPGVFVPIAHDKGQPGTAHMYLLQQVDAASGTATVLDANGHPQSMALSDLLSHLPRDLSDEAGGIGTLSGAAATQAARTRRR